MHGRAHGTLCLDCIVNKTGVPAPRAQEVLERIHRVVKVTEASAHCDGCLRGTTVFRLG